MEYTCTDFVISVHLNVTSTDYFTVNIRSSSSSALGLMMMTDKRSISSLLKSFTGVCSDTPAPAETHIQMRDLDIFSVEIPPVSYTRAGEMKSVWICLPVIDKRTAFFRACLPLLNIFCITLYFALLIN